MSTIRAILQRLPTTVHLLIALFAIYGESWAPLGFTILIWGMHLALINANLRTLYGIYQARQGVQDCSSRDWRGEVIKTREKRGEKLSQEKQGDGEVLEFEDVLHVIVIPNYMEDIETLRQTLECLSSHPLSSTTYIPILCMELRESSSPLKALQLLSEFRSSFKDMRYTLHPGGVEGEIAGKGSNVGWATRSIWMAMKGEEDREKTVFTIMDSDTNFAADYFEAVTAKFAMATPAQRRLQMFVPPIVFDRNAKDVPVGVRVTDIFWAMGGMSTMYEGSSAKVPTSAYSVSLTLAESVGGWDPDTFAIGEDMHMFLKCAISTRGNLISETIYSPASQMDVMGPVRGGLQGLLGDYKARYKQAVRHLWGSLDIAYTIHRMITGDLKRHPDGAPSVSRVAGDEFKPEARRYGKILGAPEAGIFVNELDEDEFALSECSRTSSPELFTNPFGTDTFLPPILEEEDALLMQRKPAIKSTRDPIQYLPLLTMLYRVYEACLMMGNITMFVVARAVYAMFLTYKGIQPVAGSLEVHPSEMVQTALFWSERMRQLSGILLVITALTYDRYHRYTAKQRWENDTTGRLGQIPKDRSHRTAISTLDYFALPATILFGPIAMLHAHFMHVFTNKLTYTVSLKLIPASATSYNLTQEEKRFGNPMV